MGELEDLLKSSEKERERAAHKAQQMSDKVAVMQSTNEEVCLYIWMHVVEALCTAFDKPEPVSF